MSVRAVRQDGTGSSVIAAANNAPTGTTAAAVVSNNSTLALPTMANYTTLADAFNSLLAACKAHGIVNTA